MTKRILVAACLSTVVACLPKKESHSESKFSAATATLLDDYITTSMMREFCKKTPIFFYFGNAEGIVSITGEDGTMRAGSAETELEKEVKASAGHLRNMLRRMPHACESAFKANQAPYASTAGAPATLRSGPPGTTSTLSARSGPANPTCARGRIPRWLGTFTRKATGSFGTASSSRSTSRSIMKSACPTPCNRSPSFS
jgi:hypothetical protein